MSDEQPNDEKPLESGWELTTPPDDTIMHQVVQAIAGDLLSQANAAQAKSIVTDDFVASDLGESGSYSNSALLLRPITADISSEVARKINAFFDVGNTTGFAGIVSVWPEPDFRPFGWSLGGHPPVHYQPVGTPVEPDPAGVDIHLATRVEELHAIIECAGLAFGETKSNPADVVSERSLHDPRRQYWVAEVDGQIAGGASLWLDDQVNYVGLVATHPDFQRRGIGKALTARASFSRPDKPAVLFSSDQGRMLYDKMGYLRVLRMSFWYRYR